MNQNLRICKIQGHERYPVFHICTLFECNQITRWCCPECIQKGTHHHNKPNNEHIMNMQEVLVKLMNEQEKFKKDYLEKHKTSQFNFLETILNKCQMLEKSLIDYRICIQKQIEFITSDEDQARFEQYLQYLNENNFELLDDDKIDQLLNVNQKKLFQNKKSLLSQPLVDIKLQINQIEQIIKDYKDNQNDNSDSTINLKSRKYIISEIDQTNNKYYASQISKNEQYLAYGAFDDKLLRIYDIKLKNMVKEIELLNNDSSQLFVGGYLCGYDAQDNFKEIYKSQIHKQYVYNIITIQNEYIITCSHDQSIIKTDIKKNQQIFKLNGHTEYIIAMDYNYQDEIIVSGSGDKSIKLWNCKNLNIIINKEKSHNSEIRQIQFINNNLNILSLDKYGDLYKWTIDLLNKDLIKLQSFSDQNKIFNFYYFNQEQNLLLICDNYVKIINQQGETLNKIEHGGQNSTWYDCRQLDNLKYIQIRALNKILLAVAQD